MCELYIYNFHKPIFMKLQSNELMQRRNGRRHKILRLDRMVKQSFKYCKSLMNYFENEITIYIKPIIIIKYVSCRLILCVERKIEETNNCSLPRTSCNLTPKTYCICVHLRRIYVGMYIYRHACLRRYMKITQKYTKNCKTST